MGDVELGQLAELPQGVREGGELVVVEVQHLEGRQVRDLGAGGGGQAEEEEEAVGRGHLWGDLRDLVAGEDDLGHVHLVPPVLLTLAVHAHLGGEGRDTAG